MSTFTVSWSRIFTEVLHSGRLTLLFALTILVLPAQTNEAGKLTRLYVEPFKTSAESQKLYRDIVSELHKQALSLVTDLRQADAILDGGGDIWVKGYRSLNPRSGELPQNGTPVYDGYLSVELRDPQGQTFWSYLATPGAAAQDVSRDLAKRIAKQVAEAMKLGEPTRYVVATSPPATFLKGAGATFPEPVYTKWFTNYRRENSNLEISYDPVGSEAGIRELLAGKTDFGATESPEAIRDLAPDQQSNYLLFPSVVGAVVPIVNLPGLSGVVSLTPEALAGIYLGRITKWDDPILQQSNRGLHLPALAISVVHRLDGSGTSYAWTTYLSQANTEWRTRIGASLHPKWPTGSAANGNDGVAKAVKEFGGSIGYVEFIYALQNHMSFARVRNQNGEFVGASLESIAVAVNEALKVSDDMKTSIVNAPGAGAYPIASFTWLVIPKTNSNRVKSEAMRGFLEWMLGPGQTQAAALGYLALPHRVVARAQAALKDMHS